MHAAVRSVVLVSNLWIKKVIKKIDMLQRFKRDFHYAGNLGWNKNINL